MAARDAPGPGTCDDASDAWMALPLFNRKDSPDHTRNVLAWQPEAMDFDIPDLDYGFFHDYEMIDYENLTPSHVSDASQPQSDFIITPPADFMISAFQFDAPLYTSDLTKPQPDSLLSAFQFDAASYLSDSSRTQSGCVISPSLSDINSHSPDLYRPQPESVISAFPSDAAPRSSDSTQPQADFIISAFQSDGESHSSESRRQSDVALHSSDLPGPQSDFIINTFQFDTVSHSPDSVRPHSDSVISASNSDSGYESHAVEKAHPSKRRNLLNEISDEHIPQPVFTSPCQCTFPDCKSTTIFTTGRDFRRHYRQHFKRFFCRYEECPQSTCVPGDAGTKGFATRKDRARHEAKHNPAIKCPWQDRNGGQCTRTFSRMDNMRDHYRRIHKKGSKT
ncbi:trichothecene biosynthesis transcription factor [Paramyrothecium foliicola]|nr:trichothecene biosynthesis transcription factor [Paramyrothecium foliicola]